MVRPLRPTRQPSAAKRRRRGGASRTATLARFLLLALPSTARELRAWRQEAAACPDAHLRSLALASIEAKAFHCLGGSVFSVWPGSCRRTLVQAIVALQTISDYLDNLCDRAGVQDGQAFRQLHQAFLDALDPAAGSRPEPEYYALYPYRNDGGYLARLVQACQQAEAALPGYAAVKAQARQLGERYCSLQVHKHLEEAVREKALQDWLRPLLEKLRNQVFWWELAAATGSTLGIFALYALASGKAPAPPNPAAQARPSAQAGPSAQAAADAVVEAYFPWIGGLHILLDYLIDQQEDRLGGDLNFVEYYGGPAEAARRLSFFLQKSLDASGRLPDAAFHRTVIEGLLAMYLSDPKARAPELQPVRQALLRQGGPGTRRLFWLCTALRRAGAL